MSESLASGGAGAGARLSGILHLLNGDITADLLRASGVPGTLSVWADVLHEGPVPRDLGSAEGRETRARFLARRGYAPFEEARATSERWDRALESAPSFAEVVLWLEHDLFDQLLLIHHLHRLSRRDLSGTRLSLVCIGEHPDVEPFLGLGQLAPQRLAELFAVRTPIGERELEAGREAWEALTAADPTELQRLLERDIPGLPFLVPALRRLLEEYPAVDDGLSRTERQILEEAAEGPRPAADLLRALHRRDRVHLATDASLAFHLRDLAGGNRPLLVVEGNGGDGELLSGVVSLTEAGREVLAGGEDRVAREGIDRWVGGVHLQGADSPWRWDRAAGCLRAG